MPGRYGYDYIYPSASDISLYVATMNLNVIRLPFKWDRLQPKHGQPLDSLELARIDAVVSVCATHGVSVLLDPHNYGYSVNGLIGTSDEPTENFTDFWIRLAQHYLGYDNVIFGIMNEPHTHTPLQWADIAQTTLNAIRSTGATQLVLVPGTFYTGAHSWTSNVLGQSNAEALKNIKDSANNFMFEMHQYLDSDNSGTHSTCVSSTIGSTRLKTTTDWLRQNGFKAFLGEFGASDDTVCMQALYDILQFMGNNTDVWHGWTYWNASPWSTTYIYAAYPPDENQHPQVSILKEAMGVV
ncbi:predicted protein [Naegleria gruberi]|uniref:Predicted protein n=1 Tax=Naegleria gruberi TaxID=5762 RepID=D2VZ50_NAEGR|nr:uncharacterized protein NAEGRDRAFT_53412 [Naegleria gruberi]EFC37881.1 predicted protein [Naegleria gruberi]|eukprot:XP_002670625.1 predicted protein [Naegleria gruberi strain NEG-M]